MAHLYFEEKKKVPSQYKVVDKIPHNADQHAEMASVDAKGNVYNPNSFHSALLMLMVLPSKRRTGLSYNFGWQRKKCSLINVFLLPVSQKVGCTSLSISAKVLALYRDEGSQHCWYWHPLWMLSQE